MKPSHELSRRAGNVLDEMTFEQRQKVRSAVLEVEDFEGLPQKIKDLIIQAEEEQKKKGTFRELE